MHLITVDKLDKYNKGLRGKSVFDIDFISATVGDVFSVSTTGESYTGTVPVGYNVEVPVKGLNKTYRISLIHDESTFYTDVEVGSNYGVYEVTINAAELTSIEVRTSPTKLSYLAGDFLDTTGLEITANYSDGSALDVTEDCTFNFSKTHRMTEDDDVIIVYYTESGVTKSVQISISVVDLEENMNYVINNFQYELPFTRPTAKLYTSAGVPIKTSTGQNIELTTLSQSEIASLYVSLQEEIQD